ncbi:unnamed protein product [Rangifer tarandus platyrhynchus]|uniref:Uncharacterized protein n=1 Tax=Rangifer tarandus platyrhynchus TaxID=3082113 RepID=A0AC59Y396_RANTA
MNQKRSVIPVIPGPSLSHLSQTLWFFSWILWILSLPHHQILDPTLYFFISSLCVPCISCYDGDAGLNSALALTFLWDPEMHRCRHMRVHTRTHTSFHCVPWGFGWGRCKGFIRTSAIPMGLKGFQAGKQSPASLLPPNRGISPRQVS